MKQEEIKEIFDNMATSYDEKWVKLAPLRDALHLLIGGAFAPLPVTARILCVGAGTGAEIIYLAQRFPQWTFTAIDPSAAMLEVCRRRLEELGIDSRCEFHTGYIESLPTSGLFDAATSLLVSQFILDKESRSDFFRLIARQLKPGGILVSSDLSANPESVTGQKLIEVWLELIRETGIPQEGLERMRSSYGRDVAVLPENEITGIIASSGFEMPTGLFRAGLIHAWYSTRALSTT